jgi:hypothetical protein
VVDEEAAADLGRWVDLDTGKQANRIGQHPGQQAQADRPQLVCCAMDQQGVYTGVGKQHLKAVACRWIAV